MGYSIWDLLTQNDPFYSEKVPAASKATLPNPRTGRVKGSVPVEYQGLQVPRSTGHVPVIPQGLSATGPSVPPQFLPQMQEVPLPQSMELPLPVAPQLTPPPTVTARELATANNPPPVVGTATQMPPVQMQEIPIPPPAPEKGFFDRDWGQLFTSPMFLMGANLLANSTYDPMKQNATGAFGAGLAGGANSIAEVQKWKAEQKAKANKFEYKHEARDVEINGKKYKQEYYSEDGGKTWKKRGSPVRANKPTVADHIEEIFAKAKEKGWESLTATEKRTWEEYIRLNPIERRIRGRYERGASGSSPTVNPNDPLGIM